MSAVIKNIHGEVDSPLLMKLKEKDRERAKKVIAEYYKKLRRESKLKKAR